MDLAHSTSGLEHTSSYYAASANPSPERPALQGEVFADVCVVGAGYSGLSTALHLLERGYDVAILESAKVGWGASGRNGGQIVNGLNASLETIQKRYGDDFTQFVGGLVSEGGKIIRDRIVKYDIQCDLKEKNVFAAFTEKQIRELEAKKQLWSKFGMNDHEMLDREQIKNHVNTDAYLGGMVDHSGGHMHPLNLALGEAAAIEKLGGKIFENSRVTTTEKTDTGHIVRTANGQLRCKILVFCGNAYLGDASKPLKSRVMPVSTQILATEPLSDELAHRLLPTDTCIEDVRYILDYYRLSADKRLLFGGGTVYGGTDPADIVGKLRPNMLKIFPELSQTKIDYAWSGNFALSFSRVPQLGRLNDSTYFAHGYSGHGVTGSHLFGRILAEAIDGDLSRFDVFSSVPWIPFPGGRLLRVPYSTIGSWYYALKDKLGL